MYQEVSVVYNGSIYLEEKLYRAECALSVVSHAYRTHSCGYRLESTKEQC
jgi:hypothetical protein